MPLDLSTTHDTAAVEDEGIRITLNDEQGDPYTDPDTGAEITALVAGTYSKRFTKAQRKINERTARAPGKLTAEQREKNAFETFAACVIEWDLVHAGAMAPPAPIFAQKPHIYEQIVNAATNHAAFFAARSTP